MMRLTLLSFLLLLSSETVYSQFLSWRDIVETEAERPTHILRYGPDSLQFGELWLPEDRSPHTTVIMIHGGCWLSQYPGTELMHLISGDLRRHGFAVWNLEYRRIGHEGGGFPGTFKDIARGTDYLREIAGEYGIPIQNIIAAGHSAGGHLAGWLAARPNIPESSPLFIENPLPVNGVISLAGINNLKQYARYGSSPCGEGTIEELVDQPLRGDAAYSDTSPSELLPLGVRVIEVSAAYDSPVPPFFGHQFVQDAAEAGDNAELLLLTESAHFEMIHHKSKEWQQVRSLFLEMASQ